MKKCIRVLLFSWIFVMALCMKPVLASAEPSAVESIEITSCPYQEGDTVYIQSTSAWAGFPIDMSDFVITVTTEDESAYEFYWQEDDENIMDGGSFVTDDGDGYSVSYSLPMGVNQLGNYYFLGDNTLTFSCADKTASIDLFLYTMTDVEVTPAPECNRYPFGDLFSLKGKSVKVTYSDNNTETISVTEDVSGVEIQGQMWYLGMEDDKIMLAGYEVGSKINILPMSGYPEVKNITPGVPVDVTIGQAQRYVVFRFTPQTTGEYKFYATDGAGEQNDTFGYICSDTELLTENDDLDGEYDDNDNFVVNSDFPTTQLNFGIRQNLQAGTAYYLVVGAFYSEGETVAAKCHVEPVIKVVEQKITAPASITKNATDAGFALGATALGNVPLTYQSSNPSVAVVDANGTVTIMGAGTTTITISAAATQSYTATTSQVTLVVNPVAITIAAPDVVEKVYGAKDFALGATSNGVMQYASDNTEVATVDAGGMVQIKKCGKAVITISATADKCIGASKQIEIRVVPKKAKVKSVKSTKAGQMTVKWTSQKEAKGYIIEYSTDKNFKKNVKSVKVNKNKTTSKTIKKLKKGKKYYVRVKAYVTIDKKAETGAASAKKNVKIKK